MDKDATEEQTQYAALLKIRNRMVDKGYPNRIAWVIAHKTLKTKMIERGGKMTNDKASTDAQSPAADGPDTAGSRNQGRGVLPGVPVVGDRRDQTDAQE